VVVAFDAYVPHELPLWWPEMEEEEVIGNNHEGTVPFEFPIKHPGGTTQMNNITPSVLPNFHGLESEDLDAFLFEFDVLCRSYDYSTISQKLKLFPTTLKGVSLLWFMCLSGDIIQTWDEMCYRTSCRLVKS